MPERAVGAIRRENAGMKLPEPTPERIRKAREAARLSQPEAAELVWLRHAMRWSEYERGVNGMPLATWELFLLKTGQRALMVLG